MYSAFHAQEAVVQRCFVKKVFLEISQNSQENTCARVSFLRLWHRCFPVNFVKFLRTPFLTEHLWTTASDTLLSLYKQKTCAKNA